MDIHYLLRSQDGVATASDLERWGVSRDRLDHLVRAGVLIRARRGAYMVPPLPTERPDVVHARRAVAILRTLPDAAALAHVSALAAAGLPVIGPPGHRVHVVRTDWRPELKHRGQVRLHALPAPPVARLPDGSPWPGVRTIHLALAAMQVAADGAELQAKAALDALLHQAPGLCEELAGLAALLPGRSRRVARLLDLVDPRIESPGESWLHLVLRDLGLEPELQVDVRDANGLVGRVDFRVGRTVIEFDGALKYEAQAQWVAEKRRELRLRALGYRVVRFMWDDLADPDKVRHLLAVAA